MSLLGKCDFDFVEFAGKDNERPNNINRIGIPYNGEFQKYHVKYAVAGDTDSIYLKIPERIIDSLDNDEESLIEFSDMIGSMSNEAFPDYCKWAFNVPKSRENTIQTDREAVSDKSLFVTKKRYIMHVINDEGAKVDKYKSMGLEIKKTDTPPAVKVFLKKMLHALVDGCYFEYIHDEIKQFKKEFFKMGITEIGRPMPSDSMEKYVKALEGDPNLKGIPYHVRAAIYYNSRCGLEGRPIDVGEKFFVAYIKHKDSHVIGFPVDANEVPEWVRKIPLDYQKNWDKAEQKIINYLTSVGWDDKSRAEKRANEFFNIKKKK